MNFQADIESCLHVLRDGGLILYPTDTIWGIGCDATNAAAVQKIYALKQRPETKSMIVLMADQKELMQYVTQPDLEVFNHLKKAKKPTTVIYEGAVGLADNLLNSDGSAAIRIVKDEFCKHLIKRFRKPIVSTSANISGDPSPAIYREISIAVRNGVDFIVYYRQEDTTPAEPSSLIKWAKGEAEVIRP